MIKNDHGLCDLVTLNLSPCHEADRVMQSNDSDETTIAALSGYRDPSGCRLERSYPTIHCRNTDTSSEIRS